MIWSFFEGEKLGPLLIIDGIMKGRWNNFAVKISFLKMCIYFDYIAPNFESSGIESDPFVLYSSLYATEPTLIS